MKRLLALVAAAIAAPALGVGLGPLSKEGLTDGPKKGFYLTVINPYSAAQQFILTPLRMDDETAAPRVIVIPSRVAVGAGQTRRVLVIASDLAPGESYQFRVCAEKPQAKPEIIHARVCSKLRARRLARP